MGHETRVARNLADSRYLLLHRYFYFIKFEYRDETFYLKLSTWEMFLVSQIINIHTVLSNFNILSLK